MGVEIETKREIPVISLEFAYDPVSFPNLADFGEVICQIPPEKVRQYLPEIQNQWEKFKQPISEGIHRHFETPTSFFWERRTCHILDRHIKLAEKCILKGFTRPLTVVFEYPHSDWKFLPFFGDLTHEFGHIFGPLNDAAWENLENETAKKIQGFWSFSIPKKEEIVVEKVTHEILTEVFGKVFADWHTGTSSEEIIQEIFAKRGFKLS